MNAAKREISTEITDRILGELITNGELTRKLLKWMKTYNRADTELEWGDLLRRAMGIVEGYALGKGIEMDVVNWHRVARELLLNAERTYQLCFED